MAAVQWPSGPVGGVASALALPLLIADQVVDSINCYAHDSDVFGVVLGVEADADCDVLRERSSRHKVNLHLTDQQIVRDLLELFKSKHTFD